MTKKTRGYLILIPILLGLNLFLFFSDGAIGATSFDDQLFTVSDTSVIQRIEIAKETGSIVLSRSNGQWRLNDQYRVDQNFRQILFTILNRIRVKRSIGSTNMDNSGDARISFQDGDDLFFQFASDQLGTKSFFVMEGTGYQVEVPGYRENVVNIFELTADQWRNRQVFNGSWRTIQRLELAGEGQDLSIRFVDQFFQVGGVASIDSSAVVDYLNQFQFFQANEMISPGRFPELDSLANVKPLAVLTIEDIGYTEPKVFNIYPNLTDQAYHLVVSEEEGQMVISVDRIEKILRKKADFRGK